MEQDRERPPTAEEGSHAAGEGSMLGRNNNDGEERQNGLIIIPRKPVIAYGGPPTTLKFVIFSENNLGGEPQNIEIMYNNHGEGGRSSGGTCKGIVCCTEFEDEGKLGCNKYKPRLIFLCNPSTGESTLIPDYPDISPDIPNMGRFCCSFGVGYDSIERDYKILKMRWEYEPKAAIFYSILGRGKQ